MRELGRFVSEIRKTSSFTSLRECVKATSFKEVLVAVKSASDYNEETFSFKTPSLALKLGHSLKQCAENVRAEAIVMGDLKMKAEADDFITICESEWNVNISAAARETLAKRKFNQPKRLPFTDDLKKLNAYLEHEQLEKTKMLKENPNPQTWKDMAEITLAQLVLFNRRRGGETERLPLQQYNQGMANKPEIQGDIEKSLSPFEVKLSKSMNRVDIRGKRGRRVTILLTKSQKASIDLLNSTRVQGNIQSDFVFARQGLTETPIRSVDVLRKFGSLCGAEHPELITSTSLRKHIATVSQVLNLKENELDALASFMGHDIRIHREYYRLPDTTIQLAKISKLLLDLEKGNLHVHKGMSLDDISVDDDLELEEKETEGDEAEPENEDTEMTSVTQTGTENEAEVSNVPGIKTVPVFKTNTERRQWSSEERRAMQKYLGKYLLMSKLPGKIQCLEAQRQAHPALNRRTWLQMKFYVKNHKKS